ncbi:MAG: SurA N-terminal domain-containing protein [Rhizobiaceae bacterium]|nr:SurA N-terminal domain-containing protein [Rhizobiaceae bacterium]
MLDSLRRATQTWIAKLLFIILVISFVGWGVSGQIQNGPSMDTVVTVGDTSVSPTEYRLAYDRAVAIMSQQFGTRLTVEQTRMFGLPQQVLGTLVGGAVLSEQARRLGLGLSKDRIATLTAEDPAFRGSDGRFDRQQFDYVLRQVGMSAQDYFDTRANEAVRLQIVDAAANGMDAPATFLRAVALYRGEDRTVEYVVLPKSLVEPIEEPSAEILAKWFDENKAKYSAPEYRKIAYVKLEPEDIADTTAIADEQVKQDYEAHKDRYTTPETRAVDQLVFSSEEEARKVSEELKSGVVSFDAAVAAQNKQASDVSLGSIAKDSFPDKAVAEAAFSLIEGQTSDVVAGTFGPVILRVSKINPQVVKTLAEVQDEIRKDLALTEANRILLDVHDAYEDARAGGASLEDAAQQMKLKVVTVEAVDRQGKRPDSTVIDNLPASAELLEGAFQAEVKAENQPLNIGSTGYVFYEVESVEPARDRKLDEVKEQVVADWKANQASQRLQAKGDDLAKKAADSNGFDAAVSALGLEKQTKRGLKRGANDVDFGQEGVAAVFAVADGQTGQFNGPDGESRIVFRVVETIQPANADASSIPEDARNTFADGMANDLIDQLVQRLRGEYDVEINQAAIDRALSF